MTTEDNEAFKDSAKCWICEIDYVDNDDKVTDHCHIKRFHVNRCNINVKLNHNIPVVFHNLKIF